MLQEECFPEAAGPVLPLPTHPMPGLTDAGIRLGRASCWEECFRLHSIQSPFPVVLCFGVSEALPSSTPNVFVTVMEVCLEFGIYFFAFG